MKNNIRKPDFLFTGLLASLLMLCSVWSQMSLAQQSEHNIAVLNVERSILNTEYGRAQLEESKKLPEVKDAIEKLKALEVEAQELLKTFTNNADVMSPEQRELEERRLRDKQKDGQHLARKLAEAEKEWRERMMREMGPTMRDVLEGIVTEEKITLILRAGAGPVVHFDASYDITAKVTERLNQIYK